MKLMAASQFTLVILPICSLLARMDLCPGADRRSIAYRNGQYLALPAGTKPVDPKPLFISSVTIIVARIGGRPGKHTPESNSKKCVPGGRKSGPTPGGPSRKVTTCTWA
ncbi:hypothetical protein JB92DRAFT_908674 [Gautieria morchelliformis]|nr:hypothetical protein JB92DRAFT_908674 [Gautieria morchelliformis]